MMRHSDIRVIFFQVQDIPSKFKRITETAKIHFMRKERLLFFVEDEKAQKFTDELLWKIPETQFLPHSVSDTPTADLIVITKSKTNVNQALFAFNLCPTPLFLPDFKLIYEFEDLSHPHKKSLSEIRFNAYKQANLSLESM
ncbi:MAG: DNA polymerase III subunit chi [Chlamydiia bacterium]|nr:DNA polymerase III subunit chi [Chlamydiia bacterium]